MNYEYEPKRAGGGSSLVLRVGGGTAVFCEVFVKTCISPVTLSDKSREVHRLAVVGRNTL